MILVIVTAAILTASTALRAGGPLDLAAAAPGTHRGGTAAAVFQNLAAAGSDALCGIRPDHRLDCWGHSRVAVSRAPAGAFTGVSAARRVACGLRADATMACWGRWWTGRADSLARAPEGTFASVDLAESQGCAIRTDGRLVCFGWFDAGASAADAGIDVSTPPPGTFTAVAAVHDLHGGCAIRTDGRLACWGDDSWGQATPPSGTFTDIAAGRMTLCAIRSGGELACWGRGLYGAAEPPAGRYTDVAIGGDTGCAIRAGDRTIVCWGADLGQPPPGAVASVAIGDTIAALIRTDGSLRTWGETRYWSTWGFGKPPAAGGFGVFRISVPAVQHLELGRPLEVALATTPVEPQPDFRLGAGRLPPGLELTQDGRLTGTPLATGSFGPVVVVADNGQAPATSVEFTIEVTSRG